jgi:predicted RNA-binding Zn ribbon-like protein
MARPQAPGALALVQAFVNTKDIEDRQDQVGTPEQLRGWLLRHDLIAADAVVTDDGLGRSLEVREALRALLFANNGEPLDPLAIETLNRHARNAPVVVDLGGDGSAELQPIASGVEEALGRMLAVAYTAMREGTWQRLKACRRDRCQWAFYDTSKNRSGAWCSMQVCGNRTKVRAYQQRHRPGAHPGS